MAVHVRAQPDHADAVKKQSRTASVMKCLYICVYQFCQSNVCVGVQTNPCRGSVMVMWLL